MGNNKLNKNVYGEAIEVCCEETMTGYLRNGLCETSDDDVGSHTVCAVMTEEFLAFSKYVGNDLSTPKPEFHFMGLKAGDQWCLCASRFLQAYDEGCAPKVNLNSTHKKALEIVPFEALKECENV